MDTIFQLNNKMEIIYLHEDMREACAEVCTINIQLFRPWDIYILAPWAIYLDPARWQLFTYANREHTLPLTQYTGAVPKGAENEFLFHKGQPTGRDDKTGVNKAVEIHGRLVNF